MLCSRCAPYLALKPRLAEQVGPLARRRIFLNSGWRLDPVGKQIPLDTLPMSSVVTPDGKYMLVLVRGYKPPSISVIDVASGSVKSSTSVPDAWLGMTISPGGDPRLHQRRTARLFLRIQPGKWRALKQDFEFPTAAGPTALFNDLQRRCDPSRRMRHLLYAADR